MGEAFLFARIRAVGERRVVDHFEAVDDANEATSTHEDERVNADGLRWVGTGTSLATRDVSNGDAISIEDCSQL
jgi:hypothetical protein